MKQAKYYVGDRVLITQNLTKGMVNSMKKYCNSVMTIQAVLRSNTAYKMLEDDGVWAWNASNIVGRVVKKGRYKAGDRVVIDEHMAKRYGLPGSVATINAIVCSSLMGLNSYTLREDTLSRPWRHGEILGCLEQPEESAAEQPANSVSRQDCTETITITTDGTHTKASLTTTGPSPTSFHVSLRRDSRDSHNLYSVAHLAVDKLRLAVDKSQQPLYTGEVFCVDPGEVSMLYTAGKIYSVKNGVLKTDPGEPINYIKSFQWLQTYSAAKWMEVVK